MTVSRTLVAAAAAILRLAPITLAGFSPSSDANLAIYWGQNSANGADTQERLSYYCQNPEFNIVILAFVTALSTPTINFASATNDCTAIPGTGLFTCPEIEADIQTCQQTYGKTVMLSLGGFTYTEGGFTSQSVAETAAQNIWGLFGSDTAYSNRPFGSAVVDGFDFDFESTATNMQYFANKLRSLMDADNSKTYYLSAAPQCPYPDISDNAMLDGAVPFDWINVQFYNNYCEVSSFVPGASTQNNFDFTTWDSWASDTSLNKDVKVLTGAPANTGAGGGYVDASVLAEIVDYCKSFNSFGGVMLWDASQLWANAGFLDTVYDALKSLPSGGSSTTTTTNKPTATSSTKTTSAPTTTTTSSGGSGACASGVAQWGQCGGSGYTGCTNCASPYTCVATSEWWSQCE